MTSITPHAKDSAKPTSQETSPIASAPDMPEQRHAGKVGYGPNYHAGPTLEDKVIGLKEELMGKITHKPERFRHGHEMLTGEERRKKLTGSDEPDPFHMDKDHKSNNQSEESQTKINDSMGVSPGTKVAHDQGAE